MSGDNTTAIVIDGSAVIRAGLVSVLSELGIQRVAGIDHDHAFANTMDWGAFDLVVLGGVDRTRSGDQFPGPALVSRYRRSRTMGTGVAIVVSPMADDPRFRRRLHEAGADGAIDPAEITDPNDLAPLIGGRSSRHRIERPGPFGIEPALGIERSSRINCFVERVLEVGAHHLHTACDQPTPPSRSRWWLHLRRDLTLAGRLRVVNRDGSIPDRNQTICSIGQLRRVYEWATRIDPPLD